MDTAQHHSHMDANAHLHAKIEMQAFLARVHLLMYGHPALVPPTSWLLPLASPAPTAASSLVASTPQSPASRSFFVNRLLDLDAPIAPAQDNVKPRRRGSSSARESAADTANGNGNVASASKRFVCPHGEAGGGAVACGYRTNRRNNLKRHIETMHEEMPLGRFCCGQSFIRKAELRRHVRAMHANGYSCHWQSCGKSFVRRALLDRHLKTHTGEKCFQCDVCKYGTSHKSNLDRHVRIHEKGAGLLPWQDQHQHHLAQQQQRLLQLQLLHMRHNMQFQQTPVTWLPPPHNNNESAVDLTLLSSSNDPVEDMHPDSTTSSSPSPAKPLAQLHPQLLHAGCQAQLKRDEVASK